ncbi:MAG: 23S rRNA (uracil(1939)-C(5))-methyltransferase RlmD [Candidatus Izemoplasmatales bacterium]
MENERQHLIVEAIDLTHDALGVCKLEDGYTVFVEGLLKGERADIDITERRKNFGFGKIVEMVEKSPYRVQPKCRHYDVCGGCDLMHMDYDVQLSFKKYRIETTLKRAGFENVKVNDIVGMINPYNYRNKIEVKFQNGEKGVEAGFFRAKSHDLVNLEECHIMPKRAFDLVTLVKNISNELGIRAYDPQTKTGELKSAVIRESTKTRQLAILLHLAVEDLPQCELFVKKIVAKIPEVASIAISTTNDESTLSTDPVRILHGAEGLVDSIGELDFFIGHRSFFQTNAIQTEKLYHQAADYAELTGKEKVIDAYCGIGSIGLFVANRAFKVFGIEVVKAAIQDARRNAEMNDIKNAFFEVGEAETVIQKWRKFKFDVIFVDPPRKGCDEALLAAIIEMRIPRVVYVSCDQATLVRDLRTLADGGYKVVEITPFDMFPQTAHVESVTLLTIK